MGMNIWKEKVLPKIKKVFEKNPGKKAAAAEVIKAFEESKEQYTTEFEGKKTELESKVVEIYEASPAEVKTLIKEPKDAGLKKHSAAVQKFLDELVKIEFPGSKPVAEAATKFGPTYVSGPITFLFEKVSTYIPEEVKKEADVPAPATAEAETTTAAAEESSAKVEVKEKEIVVEEEKKEAVVTEAAAEKVEAPAEAAPAATEAVKVEEAPAPAPAADPPKA